MTPSERARAYIAKLPPSISGQGGHDAAFRAACALIQGFDLTFHEAWPLLLEFNQRCDPPWSDRDLTHKLADATRQAQQSGRVGYLLGEDRPWTQGVRSVAAAPVTPAKPAEHSPALALADRMERVFRGELQPVPLGPYDTLNRAARALVPGTITILCGAYGTWKSFFLLHAMLHWLSLKVRFSLLAMEETRLFWLNRVLAVLEGKAELSLEEWQKDHPDETRAAWKRHEATLDAIGYCIFERPKTANEASIVAWYREQTKAGVRVSVVDPVSAKRPTQRVWETDYDLVMACEEIAKDSDSSLILSTHPPKTLAKDKQSRVWGDDVGGGKAYQDFTQTVLWLEWRAGHEVYSCRRPDAVPVADLPVNLIVQLRKTRSAIGRGWMLGFYFDAKTFALTEQGSIGRVGSPLKPKMTSESEG
jgi:hypothetical protein